MSKIDFIRTEYTFSSGTGQLEAERYINDYSIDIFGEYDDEEAGEGSVLIGKAKVSLFLLDLAVETGYSLYEIFDSTREGSDLGNGVYDWKRGTFIGNVQEIIDASNTSNILFIDRIEIMPPYRNNGFGKKVIKDIIWRFYGCCGMAILKAFPLQLESENALGLDKEWRVRMAYDKMEQHESKAYRSLEKFYKSIGFTPLHDHYLYIDTIYSNPKFDAIDLNEYQDD